MVKKGTRKRFKVTYVDYYWAETEEEAILGAARDVNQLLFEQYATAEEVDKEDL